MPVDCSWPAEAAHTWQQQALIGRPQTDASAPWPLPDNFRSALAESVLADIGATPTALQNEMAVAVSMTHDGVLDVALSNRELRDEHLQCALDIVAQRLRDSPRQPSVTCALCIAYLGSCMAIHAAVRPFLSL